ncbi:MAG: Cro/C1-type DNA-binding domain [Bacteroidota bacterium]|jgi:DNA-binding Xre family transcriptional regulator|nr:Cro/C1-type DNA-binding domain [Bacteroidota bacterium]
MIYLNLKSIFEAKGIDNPSHFLWKNGFTRHTAHNLLYNKTEGINFRHLEKLCLLLGCSPNDLFTWHNKDQTNVLPTHSLQSLKKEKSIGSITKTLQQLPVSKLNELRNFLDSLSNAND